jgi:hypothetical protein
LGARSSSDYTPEIKPKFDGVAEKYTLKFGSPSENDESIGISKGKLTLSNKEITTVFEPVVNKIVRSCSSVIASQKTEVM